MSSGKANVVAWLVGIGSFAFIGCEYAATGKLQPAPESNEESAANVDAKRPLLQIRSPEDGDVIYDDVYDGMTGIAFDIPADKQIVVLASDRYSFFLMQPFTRHNRRQHVFEQPNCRLATVGKNWKFHVGLADESAVRYLAGCARRGEWSFSDLPKGIELLDEVRVERRKR